MNHSTQTHHFVPYFLNTLCASAVHIVFLCLDLGVLGVLAVKFSGLLIATRVCTFGGSLPSIRRIDISGGHTGTSRCTCVISALSAEPAAMQKCQFSGFSRASRPPFQREICNFCNLCNICNCYNLLITELG